jgi:hypothetical protein
MAKTKSCKLKVCKPCSNCIWSDPEVVMVCCGSLRVRRCVSGFSVDLG